MDIGASLDHCALEGIGGGVTLDAGISFHDLEVHERGQLASQRGVSVGVVHNFHRLTLLEQAGVVDEGLVDGELLVSLGVHKVIGVLVFFVEELVRTAFHAGEFNLDAGVETELLHSTRLDVFEFGADKGVERSETSRSYQRLSGSYTSSSC